MARSTNLDRWRYTECLSWSANMTPRRVHFLPPPLQCKSKSLMCRQLHDMSGGVDDVHCCANHSRQFWNQLITAFSSSHHPRMLWWATGKLDAVGGLLCIASFIWRQATNGCYFQIKSHPLRTQSNGVQCKAPILKTNLTCFLLDVWCLRQLTEEVDFINVEIQFLSVSLSERIVHVVRSFIQLRFRYSVVLQWIM